MAYQTQLTLTRRQARTMLDAVKKAKHACELSCPDENPARADDLRDLETARVMLANALGRIKDNEDRHLRRGVWAGSTR